MFNKYMFNQSIMKVLFTIFLSTAFSVVAQQAVPAVKSKLASQKLLTDITIAGNSLIAIGERGHILTSIDGNEWLQANVPVNVLLTAVDFKDDKIGYATGHDATLLKTTDGGLNWSILNYQPKLDKPLLDVIVRNDNVIAVGAYGLFIQSADAGQTIQDYFQDELLIEDDRLYLEELKEFEPETYQQEKQYMLPHFNNISQVGDELFIAGEAGFLAQSDNTAIDWNLIETDYFGSYFSIIQVNQSLLLAGLRGNLFKSDDNAESWNTLNTGIKATINSSYHNNGTTFFFANSGNIFYTADNETVHSYTLDDGKAVMSGVVLNDFLYLATEAGIKKLAITEFNSIKVRD